MAGAFGQFAFSCASYFIVIVHRIGAGAIDEGGKVVSTYIQAVDSHLMSLCVFTVCVRIQPAQ